VKSSEPNSSKKARPKLPESSEEMKAWAAALATEAEGWPQVTTRPFFGFTALYRQKKIFGLLPRTRAMQAPNSLAFKLESPPVRVLTRLQQDPRVGAAEMRKARWFTFELTASADLRHALAWLGHDYEAAGKSKKYGWFRKDSQGLWIETALPYTIFERTFELAFFRTYGESIDSNTSSRTTAAPRRGCARHAL
jgi:hypothetical protein